MRCASAIDSAASIICLSIQSFQQQFAQSMDPSYVLTANLWQVNGNYVICAKHLFQFSLVKTPARAINRNLSMKKCEKSGIYLLIARFIIFQPKNLAL